MTKEMTRRVLQAIQETEAALKRARRYSPEFQDKKLIADYEAHLAKLQAMLVEAGA